MYIACDHSTASGVLSRIRYYEGRFGVESAALGYIASYTMGVSFLAQVREIVVINLLLSYSSCLFHR